MHILSSTFTSKAKPYMTSFWLVFLALLAGFILSVLSWLEICVEHCSANQDFRLFNLPFAFVGIAFFIGLMTLHLLSKKYPFLSQLVGWLIASSLGAEFMFILVQKYQIGHWCPVCLSIAASVLFAAVLLSMEYIRNFRVIIRKRNRGEAMTFIKRGLTCLSFMMMGFLMAFIGISQPDSAQAAVNEIKDRIAFGNKNSQVEVYFVSDWFCPSCKKIEPLVEKVYPKIKNKVTFYFVDYAIHKKSVNFTPPNLSFLINDKAQYFKARQMLMNLADKTDSPTDQEIEKMAKKENLPFKELSFLDVKTGMEFFEKVVEKYNLNSTPTIIITNSKKNKVIKLEGRDEISEEKILKAVGDLTALK
ncbi:MAG: thioredoxin domain-containing protein [Parachlamydiaceae bacterium]